LRGVEERLFEPVGSNKTLTVKARIIAASNRDLFKEVEAGRFRNDLYYRLNVVAFHLQPLRERRALIGPLVAKFVAEYSERSKRTIHGISRDALAVLEKHSWPGNIRELRNVIERAVALCHGQEIQLEDLPDQLMALADFRAATAVVEAP